MTQAHTDMNRGWIDRFLPHPLRPYALLMRLDRPVGVWLLLWPCWWSLLLASDGVSGQTVWFAGLFAVGAVIMRGAGCVVNDLADRDFDAQVTRTRGRPLPSGTVTSKQAAVFAACLALFGLVILLQFNVTAIFLGVASLGPVCLYPFMKRITNWPQIMLGIAFNWGALLGWAAVTGDVPAAAVWLYLGGLCWTVGYDTIYAHQDREDDILIGVKSTALRFGAETPRWLAGFYGGAILCWLVAGLLAGAHFFYFCAIVGMAVHFYWQLRMLDIDDPGWCLYLFKSNIRAGGIVFLGCLASAALA